MRVFLDDLRDTPEGWIRTYTVAETIQLIRDNPGQVTVVSLDNDLGDNVPEGRLVLDWIEERVFEDRGFEIPEVRIHSANPVARQRMLQTLASIRRLR